MAASRVACASFNVGSSTVITITRDKNSYTHTVSYTFGSAKGTIATKTSSTSIAWNPDKATLYAQMTNLTRRSGTVTCQTYDGNTLVGTTTAIFYASAVKEDCIPDVTATIVDTNASTIALTGDSSKLICYISKPKVTMTITPKYSANIVSKQIYNPIGLTATESPYTFDTVYSDEFRVKATDSRGYSNERIYKVGFVEYSPCFFDTITLKRTESTSTTAKLNISGYCFKGSFGVVSNTLIVKYRYKTTGNYGNYVTVTPTWKDDGAFTTSIDVPNLSLNEQYIFEIVVQDKLTSFGDGEEIVLTRGIGDIRITPNNVKFKNYIVIGDNNNTDWKGLITKRKLAGKTYDSLIGSGNVGSDPVTSLELKEGQNILGRFDIRKDGKMYNFLSNMSVAEIMSMATSSQGYCILNGGSSTPILLQWGRVSITPSAANTLTQAQVNFIHQFKGIPMIFTDKITWDSDLVFVNPYNVEEGKFTLNLKRHNVINTVIQWVAIGDATYVLPE